MMSTTPFRPIASLLIGRIIWSALACFFVVGTIQVLVEYQDEKVAFEWVVKGISEANVPLLSTSLWDIEQDAVNKQLAAIARRPEIAFVALTTLTGRIFEAGDTSKRLAANKTSIEIPSPLGTGNLGRLEIVNNDTYLYSRLAKEIVQILLGYFVVISAICLMIIFLLRRELQLPLEQLARFARELEPGKRSKLLQISRNARTYADEVDVLADGFRALQRTVSIHVDNLDALVAERTSELALHNQVLDQVNQMLPLIDVLDTMVRQIESAHPELWCSILLLDGDGKHLRHGAAPSMPDFYNQAIDGVEIGDGVGSCGTAAFRKERIVVEDIQQHSYWTEFADLARRADVQSCWSQPISDTEGQVLGTFAVYHRKPARPTDAEIVLIERYAKLAMLAIVRKRTDERLKTFARAIDQSPVSIVITDPQGAIQYVNPKFETLTGYQSAEVIGRNPRLLSSKEKSVDDYRDLWNTINSGKTWVGEFHNHRKDGSLFWEHATISPITDERGGLIHFVAVKEDISSKKEVDSALQEAKSAAEAANQAKSQFLASMSHEIRTPMNAIIGMLSLLQRTELTPQQLDYAEKSHFAAHSLLGLINDILDFSKVEAGKMTLDPQPFSLDRLLRNLAVILSTNVGNKGIEVLYDIDPNVPPVLLGDGMRLQQILINLGGNAVKFTSKGQVVISVNVAHQNETMASLRFAVQDSGIGIAPEHQTHVFDGFSQAEASTTRKFGGTGLGLAISKRLIDFMGGTLELNSVIGVGSTFTFTVELPVVKDIPSELQIDLPQSGKPKAVLIIDNNPVACEVMARLTRSWNWPTDMVHSGEAGLALVEARERHGELPLDVIYLDWHLPGMDGWETAKRIRAMSTATGGVPPVIVMVSAKSRETLSQRTTEEQEMIDGFLVKPVTSSMLLNATLQPGAGQAGLRKGRRAVASKRRLNGMRILVVEDNQINQQVAEELLISEGALVSLAANGQLGVDAVAAAIPQFDAVLMDIQMPVLDGYAATKMIRKNLGLLDLPVIAMTANAMASDREECLAAGMNEHVGKPFDLTHLVKTILRITRHEVSDVGTPNTDVSCIDMDGALARMSGMKSLYLRAAQDFVKVLPEVSIEFRQAVQADRSSAIRHMHTLKGTSALLGATALSASALELEKLCKSSSEPGEILHLADQLDRQIEATTRALEPVIQQLMQELGSPDHDLTSPQKGTTSKPEMSSSEVLALRKQLQDLGGLLATSDLAALEKFADMRHDLDLLADARTHALEEALQGLELDDAHRVVLDMLANLPEVH